VSRKSSEKAQPVGTATRQIDWAAFDARTDEEIAAGISADADAAPLLDEDWLRNADLVAPGAKKPITIRLDPDVLAHFKSRPRYQTRINTILRQVMLLERKQR
jgi:uncharacterized protein (DUF4415 family)